MATKSLKPAYKFNPKKYGFEPISQFPELQHLWNKDTYIKVSCIGGKEFGRKVYWYKACVLNIGVDGDERLTIYSTSFDEKDPSPKYNSPHQRYMGLISTHEFALQLFYHLFGTTQNESVLKEGMQRYKSQINSKVK
jgi:hypothetical protein